MIIEENVKLNIPKKRKVQKDDDVFFNENAKLGRDFAVMVAELLKPKNIYDLFAATGAMGIRIANRVNTNLILSDLNPIAIKYIKKNLKENNLKGKVLNENAIDIDIKENSMVLIDPFGSPSYVYKRVIKKAPIGTIIALKATDIGVLMGYYARKAEKKYGFKIYKTPLEREIAIRSLLLFAENFANKSKKSISPLFSYATNYYIYSFFRVIEKTNHKKGFVKCEKEFCQIYKTKKPYANQIYLDSKSNQVFIKKLEQRYWHFELKNNTFFDKKKVLKELYNAKNQYLFKYIYDLTKITKELKINMPQKSIFNGLGVFLSYDKNTLTSNLPKNKFLKELKKKI